MRGLQLDPHLCVHSLVPGASPGNVLRSLRSSNQTRHKDLLMDHERPAPRGVALLETTAPGGSTLHVPTVRVKRRVAHGPVTRVQDLPGATESFSPNTRTGERSYEPNQGPKPPPE